MSLYRALNHSLALSFILFIATACGFEPIYAYKETGYIRNELEHVRIQSVADRIGHELRNNLYDVLSPRGQTDVPRWDLEITLSESTQQVSMEQSSFSTRANLIIDANFIFKKIQSDEDVIFQANAKAISSYNILESDYANLIAERDARSRAVKSLSNDISRQLALWLREIK